MLAIVKEIRNGAPICLENLLQFEPTRRVSSTYWSNGSLCPHIHAGYLRYFVTTMRLSIKRELKNQGADSLSRVVEFQFISIFAPQANWWPILQKEIQHDPFYEELKSIDSFLIQRDGVWFQKGKVLLSYLLI